MKSDNGKEIGRDVLGMGGIELNNTDEGTGNERAKSEIKKDSNTINLKFFGLLGAYLKVNKF